MRLNPHEISLSQRKMSETLKFPVWVERNFGGHISMCSCCRPVWLVAITKNHKMAVMGPPFNIEKLSLII